MEISLGALHLASHLSIGLSTTTLELLSVSTGSHIPTSNVDMRPNASLTLLVMGHSIGEQLEQIVICARGTTGHGASCSTTASTSNGTSNTIQAICRGLRIVDSQVPIGSCHSSLTLVERLHCLPVAALTCSSRGEDSSLVPLLSMGHTSIGIGLSPLNSTGDLSLTSSALTGQLVVQVMHTTVVGPLSSHHRTGKGLPIRVKGDMTQGLRALHIQGSHATLTSCIQALSKVHSTSVGNSTGGICPGNCLRLLSCVVTKGQLTPLTHSRDHTIRGRHHAGDHICISGTLKGEGTPLRLMLDSKGGTSYLLH